MRENKQNEYKKRIFFLSRHDEGMYDFSDLELKMKSDSEEQDRRRSLHDL